ncbi:MAG: glutamine amidotransferase [Nitrosomonadales bacterium]|nr:MAG: glutamine amidotransferase [Nitrosomonadales bacterium]
MKPVAIFRHAPSEGPGYFATFLNERSIPWQLIAIDQGAPLPEDVHEFSGLVFMGGPMSVNDDLPWIPRSLNLIRQAVAADIPVLGHCLGGQLMAKALGGVVSSNPVKEIGWGEVQVADSSIATAWFGAPSAFNAFHWHGETFSLPSGATLLMSSAHCANQAFALGKHLAMQCHVEMTEEMVKEWCAIGADEIAAAQASPGVQPPDAIKESLAERVRSLNARASAVYDHWVRGLGR